jgi:vancomycin aglycone glucosyltransferase
VKEQHRVGHDDDDDQPGASQAIGLIVREEGVRPQWTKEGKDSRPFPLQRIAHWGACGKTRVVPQNRRPRPETCGNGSGEVRVLLRTFGLCGDVVPPAGIAVRLPALGGEVRVCPPPECAGRAVVGVTPAGVWR